MPMSNLCKDGNIQNHLLSFTFNKSGESLLKTSKNNPVEIPTGGCLL